MRYPALARKLIPGPCKTLRRKLDDADAPNKPLPLQFETEEENWKKIERLEKDNESLKEQVKDR